MANLFLHYAFDIWMSRYYPANPFERYADDVVVHCKTLIEAEHLKSAITSRMRTCKLELHPEKTKIVYCKDDKRKDNYHQIQFDFLSFTFRTRTCRTKDGKLFNGFNPAVSLKSRKVIMDTIRKWKMHRKSDKTIFDIARICNPVFRGWYNYFGCVNPSETYLVFKHFNSILYRWGRRKYKRLRTRKRFFNWMKRIRAKYPDLFFFWKLAGVGIRTVQ